MIIRRILGKIYRTFADPILERLNARTKMSIRLQDSLPVKPMIGMALLIQDRPEYLEHCLNSILTTKTDKYELTLLLHDDGSKNQKVFEIIDRTKQNHHHHLDIRYFRRKNPSGSWGGAFNSAIHELMKIKEFDIIGSADSDSYFHPDWLTKTMDIAIYAKKNHQGNILGPFSSFNSSDDVFHKIINRGTTPFGGYLVKERMGALNYFYFTEDFKKLGFFDPDRDDETKMTARFKKLRVRNFCTETSFIEHIGQESILNQFRPVPVANAVYALNLVKDGWPVDPKSVLRSLLKQ